MPIIIEFVTVFPISFIIYAQLIFTLQLQICFFNFKENILQICVENHKENILCGNLTARMPPGCSFQFSRASLDPVVCIFEVRYIERKHSYSGLQYPEYCYRVAGIMLVYKEISPHPIFNKAPTL